MTHTLIKNEFIGLPKNLTVAEYLLLENYSINAKNLNNLDIVNIINVLNVILKQRANNN